MLTLFQAARYLSSASFLYYGVKCIFSKQMVSEFERFHLSQFRILNGSLQIFASIGLIFGYYFPIAFYVSAGGLTLQMLLGAAVRIRVKDSIPELVPAVFFTLLNAYLFIEFSSNHQ